MIEFLKSLLDKNEVTSHIHKQLIIFIAVGSFTILCDFIFLLIMVSILKIDLLISTAVSFILATIINYVFSAKWVFINGRLNLRVEFISFFFLAISLLVMNIVLMDYFVNKLNIWYLYSKIIIVVSLTIVSFFVKKRMIFLK